MSEAQRTQQGRFHTPARRFFTLGLLLIVSTLVVVGVAEVLARQFYSVPWYENLDSDTKDGSGKKTGPVQRPDEDFIFYNLRDKTFDFFAARSADERRILVLGDSFTYGSGVADDAVVFPALLEKALNQSLRLPGVKHVEVLNGGLPGSLTTQWVDLWNNLSDEYQPDVLLIVFFLRDGTRTGSIPDFFGKIRREIVRRNQGSLLYRHSYLFRTIRDGFDRQSVGSKYTQTFVDSYFGDEGQTPEWRLAQRNLLELQAMAKKRSITVGFVIFPVLVELNESYPFRRICDLLGEFALKHGIPVHSLLPDYMGEDASKLWVSAYDQHPNERGHRIATDSMLPFVKGLLEAHEAGNR